MHFRYPRARPYHRRAARLPRQPHHLAAAGLDRDRRLSLALEGALSELIQADSADQGINLAIRRIWPGFRPGTKWTPLPVPNSHWFSCWTAPSDDQLQQIMHLNILDGSLLANGKPLGTGLPKEFVQHSSYKLLFGQVRFVIFNITHIIDLLHSKCSRSYQPISPRWITRQEA